MSYEINNITTQAPNRVINAIESASNKSGVDFSYLMQQASAESNLNPNASSKTSSATGLYQFIDSTWLSMVDKHGDDYDLNTEGKSKSEILNMRKDPKAASFMAAAFATDNEKSLNNNWGGDVGSTELYFAHFLGAGGASSFLNARDENPFRPAADLFPRAARANRNVFYNPENGKARTLEEVYTFFDKKFSNDPITTNSNTDIAKAPIPPSTPDSKLATITKDHSPQYRVNSKLSNSLVMQRSQEMRTGIAKNQYGSIIAGNNAIPTNNNAIHNNFLTKLNLNSQRQEQSSPFFGRIANQIDLMMLTQTVEPQKVVRDII